MPFRLDKGHYAKAERLPNGFLRADASLTRTGVFEYRNADGSVRRELRLPDEVFNDDSLRTLQLVPVTREHPNEPVTAANAKQYSIGTIGSDIRKDGDNVEATVMLTDADAIAEVEGGSRRDVSCGYWTELDATPGEWQGQRYDAIQRNIRYNHVAITTKGRAGNARLHLDSEAAEMVVTNKETATMEKLILDGITFETDSVQLAQAVRKEIERKDSEIGKLAGELDSVKADAEKERARADAAEKDLNDARQERDDAVKPERVRELVDARLDLERTAAPLLAEQLKKDSKTIADLADDEIRAAVIRLHDSDLNLDGKDAAYVQGRYEGAIKSLGQKRNDSASDSRRKVADLSASPRTDGTEQTEAEKAEAKFKSDTHEAWKRPLHTKAEVDA